MANFIRDAMSIDRFLERLPRSSERDRIMEALCEEAYSGGYDEEDEEIGLWPRHRPLSRVGDIRYAGVEGLGVIAGISQADAEWLFHQLDPQPRKMTKAEALAKARAVKAAKRREAA